MTLRFYMLRIMPVGLFMALTLHFGNTVYLYLTVSFIQMLKVTPYSLSLFHAALKQHQKALSWKTSFWWSVMLLLAA